MIRTLVLGAAALLALAAWTPSAQAQPCGPYGGGRGFYGGSGVSVSIGSGGYYGGGGYYGRPYYGGYGRPYYGGYGYRPYYAPVYYAPPPVYVEQPVYVQQVPVYQASTWQVAQVQTQLGRLRYYQGAADGLNGPMTRNAVANFQQDRGLIVTGNINSQVLNALSIPL